MTKGSEKAVTCFNKGFSCSQAVFSTYSEDLGLDPQVALKIAGAFGAGMAYNGETCGAVTGALMVIGLKHGKNRVEDNEAKERTYVLVQEFAKQFRAAHGSLSCKELLKYDISTMEGLKKAREEGLFTSVCPVFVKTATEIIEKIM